MIVGITGASGVTYGKRCLEALRAAGVESHLVLTRAAEMTINYELGMKRADLVALADRAYAIGDVGAPIASGSFRTSGMIIAPCSVKSMAEIATGGNVQPIISISRRCIEGATPTGADDP